eukprot:scaffold136931_cov32-Tisochrysis_lutea.AAC.4
MPELAAGARVLTPLELCAQGFYKRFSLPMRPSPDLKYLELPAFDVREALTTQAEFDLGDRTFEEEDCEGLAAAIQLLRPRQLCQVHLHRCNIGDEFAAVIEALKFLPALDLLYAAQNRIGPAAMSALSRLAAAGEVLGIRKLALPHNSLGDEGLRSIASAMVAGTLPKMEYLFVAENNVGDEGAVAIAQALEGGACPQMSRLSLQSNRLTDKSLHALASALHKGAFARGEYIYVQDNPFSEEGQAALLEAMADHPNLMQGHFGWPPPLSREQILREDEARKREEAELIEDVVKR